MTSEPRPCLSALMVAVLATSAAAMLGCEKAEPSATTTRARSQAVAASPGAAPTPPSRASAVPGASVARGAERRPKLCERGRPGSDKSVPDTVIGRVNAPDAAPLPEAVEVGGGRWTWINFWAAWCKPCKEEMPRLIAWQRELTTQGKPFRLTFVSIDDDARQLRESLLAAPVGARASYWLREGKEREDWLPRLGVAPDPELPVHVLLDPAGKVRCVQQGAVEDGDFAQAAALVGGA